MKELFLDRAKEYFGKDYDSFVKKMNEPCTQGFFLNTLKASKEEILELCDFGYEESILSSDSFYHHESSIGKSKAYELGLIYPQEIAASLTSKYIDKDDIDVVVDMCAAPGGKTINALNRIGNNCLCICNDYSYPRAKELNFNLERLGIDNVIVTNKSCDDLADELENVADLVILDAPCSGEGMIRKYPEILDSYSLNNIQSLANTQKSLLENAYRILKGNGQLVYSTCTFAFEEDEYQVSAFLDRHKDMHLIPLAEKHSSRLDGTSKLSFINGTEGQFFAIMRKDEDGLRPHRNYLKCIKDKDAEAFIKDNLNLDHYYLYKRDNHCYLSTRELFDMKDNVLRYGIYLGEIVNKRFEPDHNLYRSNSLKGMFRNAYDLSEDEYGKYISGNEIGLDRNNGYYLITYRNHSLGYGKCVNGRLKNKYPKGLRRMV